MKKDTKNKFPIDNGDGTVTIKFDNLLDSSTGDILEMMVRKDYYESVLKPMRVKAWESGAKFKLALSDISNEKEKK